MARRIPIAKPAFAPPDIPPDEDFSATAAAVGELVDADSAMDGDATEVDRSVGDEDDEDDDATSWVGTSVSLNVLDVDSAASLETDFDEELEEETATGVTTFEVALAVLLGCVVVLGCWVGVDWVCGVVLATATGVVEVLGSSCFA